jgi:Flp pilus assembly protein TadG
MTLPVLLLVIFGIIKFGIVYNNYIELTNAANAGARLFSIERGQSNPCSDVQSAVDKSATNLASGSLAMTMTESGSNPQSWLSSSGGTCPWTLASGEVSGDVATLTVTYPWTVSFLGLKVYTGLMSSTSRESIA